MKIAIAADHAGFALKEKLRQQARERRPRSGGLRRRSAESCDYPDFAQAVGREVAGGRVDRGILVCSTGIGMAIAANKIAGVRAAPAQIRRRSAAHPRTQRCQYTDARARSISMKTAPPAWSHFPGHGIPGRPARPAHRQNRANGKMQACERLKAETRHCNDLNRNEWRDPSPKWIPRSTRRSSTRPSGSTRSSS